MSLDWHRRQTVERSRAKSAKGAKKTQENSGLCFLAIFPLRTWRSLRETLLLQCRGLRGAGVEAVEEQLEGGVRLVAEIDFRTEQEDLAFAHGRFGEDGAALEVLLPPGPAAVQRFGAAEPADGVGLLQGRGGLHAEYRAVVVEHVHLAAHAIGQRIGVVEVGLEQRTRDVKLLAWQGAIFAVGTFFDEVIFHRDAEDFGDAGGSADGHDAAAALDELLELGHGLVVGDTAQHALVLGRDGGRIGRTETAATAAATAATRGAAPDGAVGED